MRLLVKEAPGPLSGELDVPCSKYHAHRALILASLAEGTSRIHGLSDAGHVRYTIQALRRLGTRITLEGDCFVVEGGPYRPSVPEISVGSSGTTLYFMTGLVSLADAPVRVVGQRYFQRRPIKPLLEALASMGVELDSPTGCPPIAVRPRRPSGGRVRISGTLSQWISGLLLLAPFATGPTLVEVEGELNERSYIDLTIRMMAAFGLTVEVEDGGRRFVVEGSQTARPASVQLPPDVGAAAFGLAATALHPSDVLLRGLPAKRAAEVDHPEAELLDIVAEMGLPLSVDEATGWARVHHDGCELSAVRVDCRSVPDMLPVLSVLGTFARGTTVLDNVAHVRLKESDRVAAMLQLNRMGGRLEQVHDRLFCRGVDRLWGADLSSFNDHRVLMALAVAASRAEGESRLTYPRAYRISYPRFLEEMNGIGIPMSTEPGPARRRATGSSSPRALAPERDVTRAPAKPSRPEGGRPVAAGLREPVHLVEVVRRSSRRRPEEVALVEVASEGRDERAMTWAELDRRADAVATVLVGLGVSPGEPVAFQLPNWAELVVVALGVLRAGAVCCPLMPIYRRRELSFMLSRSGARVLLVARRFRGRDHAAEVAELLSSAEAPPSLEHVVVVGAGPRPPEGRVGRRPVAWHDFEEATGAALVSPDAEVLARRRPGRRALAQLLFTSGTTGEPKGVLQRADSLSRAVAMEARHLGLGAADVVFVPSPMAHQTGFLYGMWLALALGVPQVLQPVWDAKVALDALVRHRCTFVQAATPFLADLVKAVEAGGPVPEALRIFVATGAAVPRGLAERATRTLDAAVCGAWGTTETCLGTLSAPDDEPAKVWGTDGRALSGVRIRVTDDAGQVLAPGQEGNFEVKSGCLFEGYLGHPDWTAAAMTPDGWYRSGDLAVIDDAGFVRISGRVKDVINRGGEKVPVAEIEQLLHEHPAIEEVAVVAMPDERLGERACAFAVAPRGLDFAEMQRHLDERQVAKQYWPERLVLVDELPRNPIGKVQKFVLRDLARRIVEEQERTEAGGR